MSSEFMIGGGSGQTPVYFHRDNQPEPAETPFYFVSFGPNAPRWVAGPRGDDLVGGPHAGMGVHERVEARIGPEYERLTGPGQKVLVGYLFYWPNNDWELVLRDPADVHAQREYLTYGEEQSERFGGSR